MLYKGDKQIDRDYLFIGIWEVLLGTVGALKLYGGGEELEEDSDVELVALLLTDAGG